MEGGGQCASCNDGHANARISGYVTSMGDTFLFHCVASNVAGVFVVTIADRHGYVIDLKYIF